MSGQPQKSTPSDKHLHPLRHDSKPKSLSHSHRSQSPVATDGNVTDLFGAGDGFKEYVEYVDHEPGKRGRDEDEDEGKGSPVRGSPHRKQAKREEDGPRKDTQMTDVPVGNARTKDEDSDRDKMDMD